MKLPKELTRVTILSRTLALLLFIILPFAGFYFGRVYQRSVDELLQDTEAGRQALKASPALIYNPDVTSWKEFKDPGKKYSLNFPQNWLISFEESPNYKDRMDVHLEGPEGKVDLLWADSYGGACEDPGYEKIQIKSGSEDICHAANIKGQGVPNNTEFWQIQKMFNDRSSEGVYLNAFSYNINRELIFQIIKSLNITAK